jgi:TonB family protein
MSGSFLGALVAFSPLSAPALAQGQTAPPVPAQSPILVPPHILGTPTVSYPDGASGDADVILVLTVHKDGHVSQVEVAEGAEPFASAAQNAAPNFQFEPALRNGVKVTARIRFIVSFRQTNVEEHQTPPEESKTVEINPDSPKTQPTKSQPIEVDVRGEKSDPLVRTLSRAEVRQIPGTFGDPFRALETLPGVVPVASGLPYFYVRGAPPGQVGYYLDGIRVPYLFHVGVGPSVVNPAMIEKVNLYSGAYPAEFGRFAGAIVTADTTAPRTDFHGEATLRLFDVGAMAETGFAGGRGTAMLGGRYSYTAALLPLFTPNATLDYRDYQARVTYDLSPRDRIGLVAFGAYDLLKDKRGDIEKIAFGAEFYRVDLRYDRSLESGGTLKMGTTFGYEQSRLGTQRNAQDRLFATRLLLTQPLHPQLTVREPRRQPVSLRAYRWSRKCIRGSEF